MVKTEKGGEMKIHIITPFYREYLSKTLVHYLEPMGIEWYPVCAPGEIMPIKKPWIHALNVDALVNRQNAWKKVNDFADMCEINDDDYYGFMCDDNMYEPGFFDIIREQTAKIIMFSMYRGDRIPIELSDVPHHATTLHIRGPNDVRPGNIDIMQYIIKGDIFRTHRFDIYDHAYSDGHYAVHLKNEHLKDIVFLPELFALFNYFQPGRYTDPNRFLKPTWKMPEIIE